MTATHFVVSRGNWRPAGRTGVWVRLPGEVRVAAFPTAEAAHAAAATREIDARGKVNPFRLGATWADRTTLPEPIFRDFVRDADLDPPAADWAAWWDAGTFSESQRGRVWEGLDRLRFFRVDERPVRLTAFAVIRVEWQYNDEWFYPGDEGGAVTHAFRTRERAEAERARLDAEARAGWRDEIDDDSPYQFDMQARRFPGEGLFDPPIRPPAREDADEDADEHLFSADEVPFYEVVEFEIEEGR